VVVANRGRLEAQGTAELLVCRTGYWSASPHPEKHFGCEASSLQEWVTGGMQEWSTRFSSASAERYRRSGEPESPVFTVGWSPAGSKQISTAPSGAAPQPQPAGSQGCSASSLVVRSTPCPPK